MSTERDWVASVIPLPHRALLPHKVSKASRLLLPQSALLPPRVTNTRHSVSWIGSASQSGGTHGLRQAGAYVVVVDGADRRGYSPAPSDLLGRGSTLRLKLHRVSGDSVAIVLPG